MKILLMRGVELAKRQTKVKTLQNCNTKALVATVGQFKEKFIWGLHSSVEMAGDWGLGIGRRSPLRISLTLDP
ncbi:hypothetical protein GS682_07425 [Nostoc sp. B(2019)]|nr:hypothetical protein [Nostoc sp. B(2019)]